MIVVAFHPAIDQGKDGGGKCVLSIREFAYHIIGDNDFPIASWARLGDDPPTCLPDFGASWRSRKAPWGTSTPWSSPTQASRNSNAPVQRQVAAPLQHEVGRRKL
jgi:hypothetical protein